MAHGFSRLAADVRHAVRGLRQAPLFTIVAIVSIAFGIGAATAMFTLVDQVLLRRLPVPEPRGLVQVSAPNAEAYGGTMGDGTELSYAMYRDLRDDNRVFSGMFCRMPWPMQVGFRGRTEQASGQMVSGSFFPLLGVRPALGRVLTMDDERTIGGHPVAVLSYSYWRARFNGDPAVLGQTIVVNRHPLEVVGVAQPGFDGLDFGSPAQIYVPILMEPRLGPAWLELEGRRFRFVQVFARLRDGVTIEQARAGIEPVYRAVLAREAADPIFAKASPETRRRFLAGPLAVTDASRGHSMLRRFVTEPLLILMAVAGGVLVIVCANVANLLIARGAARQREVALRFALGGSRGQIVRLLLVESLLLAAAGAAFGLLVASWGADALVSVYASPDNPIAVTTGPDFRILLFTSAAAVATALAAGIVPAIRSTRLDLASALKGAGGSLAAEQPRLRKVLVVVQVALSLHLLVGSALFVRSLKNLLDIDPGFRTAHTIVFGFELEAAGYDAERARAFANAFQDRLSRLPGVAGVAYAFLPLLGGGGWGTSFTVEGYKAPPGEGASAGANAVSPGYFQTMGISILAGREFDGRDDRGFATGWPYRVAVVDETFAARYFNGANPVGRHIGFGDDPGTATPIEIVGLARNAKYTAIRERPLPQVFFPYLQAKMEGVTAFIHATQPPDRLLPAIRAEMRALDPDIAVYGVTTMDALVDRSIANERLIAGLSGALSLMATTLSVIGLYGVMAYVVARRTREIGIRMALGAAGSTIAAGVLLEAGALVIAGLAAGLGASWWLGRYIQEQLYGISPLDMPTIVLSSLTLAAVAAVAAFLPANRAARIAPMMALRNE